MHELEVSLTLPAEAVLNGAVLALPAWSPGSYLVRDYARLLDRLVVLDHAGRTVPVTKLDKQRWRLPALQGQVTVRYRLFCNELTVRTNHLDASHAHIVGAATFLYLEDQAWRPTEVSFHGWPATWKVATALPRHDGTYLAADLDTLMDSPFELGTFRMHAFTAAGATFQLAVTGEHSGDETRILEGTRAIVEACLPIFGSFPFQRYLFLLTFSKGGRGGLEHRDCTSLLADPFDLDHSEGYWELFTLIAHEFFHVWNVKRMRDPVLGPFDYARETPTRLLWFHEGCTSFMQYGLSLRAGVVPWNWVARKLGGSWTENLTRAGRREQSLEEASFDAWIRHYKPNEFSLNSSVNYYDKGALVAWMMDAELRLGCGQGLERWFALLWERFGDGPVTDADLRAAFAELSGQDAGPFWAAYIQGTADLDPGAIEQAYGLDLAARPPWEALNGAEAADPDCQRRARAYSGLSFGHESPAIRNVVPDSPAARAGLSYGMEVLAVGGWRILSGQEAQRRLGDGAAGSTVEVLAAELGRVRAFSLTLVENPQRVVQVQPAPRATPAQRAGFHAWTGQALPAPAPRRSLG
jgi:predicted metalloprotease with PDZ domain